MQVDGVNYRTIWEKEDSSLVEIIDQTLLPHQFKVIQLRTMQDAAEAISVMRVRGAPLIGATATYGIALAMVEDSSLVTLAAILRNFLRTVFSSKFVWFVYFSDSKFF